MISNRSNRRIFFAISILLTSVPMAFAQVAPTTSSKPSVADLEQSVLKIVVAGPQGLNSIGTGFLVGDTEIATAGHVYLDAAKALIDGGPSAICAYKVFRDGRKVLFPVEYEKADFTHDLAILRFAPKTIPATANFVIHPLVVEDSRPEMGSTVAFLGYFAGDELPLMSQTTVAGYTSSPPSPEQIVLDVPANPGQSGSPVFDLVTGKVVGVLVSFVPVILVPGGLPTHSGLSRSVEAVHLKRLRESADVR
ncbi:MAG: serine protease [Terracidiphilus sp.]